MNDTSAKATSQKAAILAHLSQHGHIDGETSRTLFGCEALRSRIANLRREGIEIETRMRAFKSRFGHRGAHAVYYLRGFEKKVVEKSVVFQE